MRAAGQMRAAGRMEGRAVARMTGSVDTTKVAVAAGRAEGRAAGKMRAAGRANVAVAAGRMRAAGRMKVAGAAVAARMRAAVRMVAGRMRSINSASPLTFLWRGGSLTTSRLDMRTIITTLHVLSGRESCVTQHANRPDITHSMLLHHYQ